MHRGLHTKTTFLALIHGQSHAINVCDSSAQSLRAAAAERPPLCTSATEKVYQAEPPVCFKGVECGSLCPAPVSVIVLLPLPPPRAPPSFRVGAVSEVKCGQLVIKLSEENVWTKPLVSKDEHTHFTFDINHLSGILLFYHRNISELHSLLLTPVDSTRAALHMSSTTFHV